MTLQDHLRIHRAGILAMYKEELNNLRNSYTSKKDNKRISFLVKEIAKLEEIQKITSEKTQKSKSKSIDNSRKSYFNNEFNGVKFGGYKKFPKN